MLFTVFLKRNPLGTVEFLAHAGSPEELKAFQELEARTMLENILSRSTLVLRRNGIEIRKERGYLAVLRKANSFSSNP